MTKQVFPTSIGIGMSTKQAHVCGEGVNPKMNEDEKLKNVGGRVP